MFCPLLLLWRIRLLKFESKFEFLLVPDPHAPIKFSNRPIGTSNDIEIGCFPAHSEQEYMYGSFI